MGYNSIKLGIIVVYMVSEDNKKLLDIHLEKIKNNTTLPFKIYASKNLLAPKFLTTLKKYNFIEICDCKTYNGPPDDWKPIYEHTYYLKQLIKIAIDDKVTHIAILHPDSFPIKKGWAKYVVDKLDDNYELVSIFPEMSALAFFKSDFYNKYQPSLLPDKNEINKVSWQNFQKQNNPSFLIESGMGIAYKVYLEKFNWFKLKRSNRGEYHNSFGSVFDDYIFHLGSASDWHDRVMKGHLRDTFGNNLKTSIIQLIPAKIKNSVKKIIPTNIIHPEIKNNREIYKDVRNQLLDTTEEFLRFLRFGE